MRPWKFPAREAHSLCQGTRGHIRRTDNPVFLRLILAPPGERKLLFLFHKLILQGGPRASLCTPGHPFRRSKTLESITVYLLLDVFVCTNEITVRELTAPKRTQLDSPHFARSFARSLEYFPCPISDRERRSVT